MPVDRGRLLSPSGPDALVAAESNRTISSRIDLGQEKGGVYRRFWKPLVDVILSATGLLLLSPVFMIVAILIKSTSKGPIFYCQDRVGLRGKRFRIVKFRSMVVDADKSGPDITSSGDRRVTAFGAILRKTKLDEFPQLWNVLRGEMSLVGPRPELPRYVADYTPEQRRVLDVRPGITDLASIRYRHEEEILARSPDPARLYREHVLPHKLELNLEYIQRMCFLYDAELILATFKSVVNRAPDEKRYRE